MSDAQRYAFKQAIAAIAATIKDRRSGPAGAVAKVVGCTRQATKQVLDRGGICPPHWVLAISDASGVARSALRPDLYPASEDPALRPAPPRAVVPVTPRALERECGQTVIPGLERHQYH